jgi:glycosyltransferase involved in cell wall biosynthesis
VARNPPGELIVTTEKRKPRLLDVSPKVVLPPESGSRVRIFNLLLHLSESYDVRLFSQVRRRPGSTQLSGVLALNDSFAEIRYCNPVASFVSDLAESRLIQSPALRGAGLRLTRPSTLDRLLEWADVVLVEFPWQLPYCRKRAPHKPIVLASHNVEASKFASYAEAIGGRGERHRWARQIERIERRAVAGADLILAVSPDDRSEFIARYGAHPDDVAVIPNGADTSQYVPTSSQLRQRAKERLGLPDRPTVIYVGGNSAPNWAGLSWVRRLSELTDRFTFLVVGEMSKGQTGGATFVATGVVNDLAPYFAASDISICPIQFGGGTKIKLLESLAAGLPTVAFEEATRGLDLVPGQHLLVVEKDEREIMTALDRLADDLQLAQGLGEAGRQHVASRFDWRQIAATLDVALRRLVGVSGAEEAGQVCRSVARPAGLDELAEGPPS